MLLLKVLLKTHLYDLPKHKKAQRSPFANYIIIRVKQMGFPLSYLLRLIATLQSHFSMRKVFEGSIFFLLSRLVYSAALPLYIIYPLKMREEDIINYFSDMFKSSSHVIYQQSKVSSKPSCLHLIQSIQSSIN